MVVDRASTTSASQLGVTKGGTAPRCAGTARYGALRLRPGRSISQTQDLPVFEPHEFENTDNSWDLTEKELELGVPQVAIRQNSRCSDQLRPRPCQWRKTTLTIARQLSYFRLGSDPILRASPSLRDQAKNRFALYYVTSGVSIGGLDQ